MTKPKAPKSKKVTAERPVLYPERLEVRYTEDSEHGPVTLEQFSEWLGFTDDESKAKAAGLTDCLFVDRKGVKIYALNNIDNRPFYVSNCENLVQKLLQRRWKYNGEPLIFGKTGLTRNGQHQGAALYLANQDREMIDHWKELWPEPITMEKLVVFGVEEDNETANTMDVCKARNLTDVLYRSEYFKKVKPSDRKTLARMTDNCVKLLWKRTARMDNAFAPTRTHEEAIAFLEHHPRVLQAVKHIWEEYNPGDTDKWRVNSQRIGAGYAAAMLYLMAASDSDQQRYWKQVQEGTAMEKHANFGQWKAACTFWTLLCSEAEELQVVREALGQLADTGTGTGGSRAEREAILVKAWQKFKVNEQIDIEDVDLEDIYITNRNTGIRTLSKNPSCGGIDMTDESTVEADPDEDEIERRAEEERKASLEKTKDKNKKQPPKAKKAPPLSEAGD